MICRIRKEKACYAFLCLLTGKAFFAEEFGPAVAASLKNKGSYL
jgi:hypothetical protein